MRRLLIRNVVVAGAIEHILIEGERIAAIGAEATAEQTIDGEGLAAMPALVNGHTHAAMTLLRGYADDMRLEPWLREKIWPVEERLGEEDYYWGTKLACLEMIQHGTTLFNDMYFDPVAAARATEEMGLQAVQGISIFDHFDSERAEQVKRTIPTTLAALSAFGDGIIPAIAPHSIYTVSPDLLAWLGAVARERDLPLHIHLSETGHEVEECVRRFDRRPAEHLQALGCLGPKTILAHCNHLNEAELDLLAASGATVAHNPVANMKLASGAVFPWRGARKRGIRVLLGTDGTASNNGLDLFQDMRIASLLQKQESGDPTLLSAQEVYQMASEAGFAAFGIDAGRIEIGRRADIILIDLLRPELTPCHNLVSNLVYAASGACVDTTICAGRVLMRHRVIEGSEEIIHHANEAARRLVSR